MTDICQRVRDWSTRLVGLQCGRLDVKLGAPPLDEGFRYRIAMDDPRLKDMELVGVWRWRIEGFECRTPWGDIHMFIEDVVTAIPCA